MIKTKPTDVELNDNQFYLPAGLETEEGIFRKVTLRGMDGAVEEAVSDNKIQNNAGKVVTELLFGIVESIEGIKKVTKEHIRALTVVDRDFLIAMNFLVSFGDLLKYKHSCTCDIENEVNIKVSELPVSYLESPPIHNFTRQLFFGIKTGTGLFKTINFSLPTGKDQENVAPIVKTNQGQANTALLTNITLSIDDEEGTPLAPINFTTFQKMMKKDRDFINSELKVETPGVDFNVIYTCACGKENKSRIPVSSFLSQ